MLSSGWRLLRALWAFGQPAAPRDGSRAPRTGERARSAVPRQAGGAGSGFVCLVLPAASGIAFLRWAGAWRPLAGGPSAAPGAG